MAMKSIILFLLLFSVMTISGQSTITSISNGIFSYPSTWDCICSPSDGDDIHINHNVTLDFDFIYNSGSISVNGNLLSDSPTRSLTVNGGWFYNAGNIFLGNFNHSSGSFTNDGNITIDYNFKSTNNVNTQNFGWLNIHDSLYVDSSASILNANILDAQNINNCGIISNTASMSGSAFSNSGTYVGIGTWGIGFGILTINNNIFNTGTISNSFNIVTYGDIYNCGVISNENDTSNIFAEKIFNSDTISGDTARITNNGEIKVKHNFLNTGLMNGNGNYCIGDSSINSGSVMGALTFCDSTGFVFDINTGTIDATVSFCSSPCQLTILDSREYSNANSTSVYPNPFSNQVNFEMNENSNYALSILNSIGEIVFTNSFNGNRYAIAAESFVPGMYFYRIEGNDKVVSGTLVKE